MDQVLMNTKRKSIDTRRDLVIGGSKDETIRLCIQYFIESANSSITKNGSFHVALSGGSTPKVVFKGLKIDSVDWSKVYLYWSDERSVDASHPDSNYRMAMEAGFNDLPIPQTQIFRMKGEGDTEAHALDYEKTLPENGFDLIMLGMGDDGHTASLFPKTHALHSDARLVVANFIPKLNTWRLTLTYRCIHQAKEIVVYVLGGSKAAMLKRILEQPYIPNELPLQRIGTALNKALIITDSDAASQLL